MDREILFRGKRIDNGEWVEGYYMKHINRTPCIINDSVKEEDVEYIIFYDAFSDWNMPRGIEWTYIDPATLGQYTGLTDKNGVKIFEGDVLAIDVSKKFVVCYGEGKFYMDGTAIPIRHSRAFNVIGNIHDNPELMEGE